MVSLVRRMRSRATLLVFLLLSLCCIYIYKRSLAEKYFDDNFLPRHYTPPSPAIYGYASYSPQPQIVLSESTTAQPITTVNNFPMIRIVRHKEDAGAIDKHVNATEHAENFGGQGCKLAELKVDDPELSSFFSHVPPLKCKEEKDWVFIGNGSFEIDPEAIARHGNISCLYINYWRQTDHHTEQETVSRFPSGAALKGDFFKAQCKATDGSTYRNVHAGIRPSYAAIERARNITAPAGALPAMNVYLLGFDSISRMTFMRKMPKLYKHLTDTLGAVVLKGYNIVGDGTPQALIPILTSKTEVELPLTRKRFSNAQYVNVYPFLWNDYRDAGYVTLYGEDAASIGTFTYRLKGFDAQPTDHYMRTFYTFAEKDYHKHPQYCLGSLPHHIVHFRYVEKFFQAYPSLPKFAFQFHSLLSHDNINFVEVADDDMVKHLQLLENEGFLNNTMLLVFSDHGHRFASLRETQQGKLEERLPFFSIRMPSWFERQYPEQMKNLRANAERLTTPFDIYPTLKSVLNFKAELTPKTGDELLKNRAISLFQPIPAHRSCGDAQIEPHWCACLSWEPIDLASPLVTYLANSIVSAINEETAYQRQLCVELKLKSIDRAFLYKPPTDVLRYKKAKDYDGFVPDLADSDKVSSTKEFYQLNFHTIPGEAHYEASLTLDKVANEIIVDLDQVSHVNAYGDKPHCVIDKDYFLAKWCICPDRT